MRGDGVAPNSVTLRSALRALENASHTLVDNNNGQTQHRPALGMSKNVAKSVSTSSGVFTASSEMGSRGNAGADVEEGGGGDRKRRPVEAEGISSNLPWQISYEILDRLAGGEEAAYPAPLDFATGLGAACRGGAEWSSVLKAWHLIEIFIRRLTFAHLTVRMTSLTCPVVRFSNRQQQGKIWSAVQVFMCASVAA